MRLYYNSATPPAETWVRVSAIVSWPDITTRNNAYGICNISLRDLDGALFPTWNSRDLIEMKVTDDSGTPKTLFRGYLMNKKFHAKDLILELAGIGILLYRRSFGSGEIKSYILAQGYPKTLNANTQIDLHKSDNEGGFENFDWVDEQWIKGGKNVGLIIKDNTDGFVSNIYWASEDPIAQAGGAVQNGDFNSTITFDDDDYYQVKDETTTPDLVITATMEGDLIAIANKIKEIQIEYSFKISSYFDFLGGTFNCYLEIKKDTEWITIDKILYSREFSSTYTSGWCQGLPNSLKEGSNPFIITEGGDATELAKYFTLDGGEANYESVELRLRCAGNLLGVNYGHVYIDYLRVRVIHHADDVLPIMRQITDSGFTGDVRWVKCSSVADWTQMGITVDVDAFQIGESTIQIVQDIAGQSGLNIDIIPNETTTGIVRPNGDITKDWLTPVVGSAHLKINEGITDPGTPDGDPMATGGADTGESNVISFGSIADVIRVERITVHFYGKEEVGVPDNMTVDINLGGWIGAVQKNMLSTYLWYSADFEDLNGSQADLDGLEVKFTAGTVDANNHHYIDEAYCVVHYKRSTWVKFMARKFKGQHCIEALRAVLNLEGAEWCEDYPNNRIKLIKKTDFESSGVSITQTDYDHDWEYEDKCNEVKYIFVWGKTSFNNDARETTNIFAKAVSLIANGENSKQITDDNIYTVPEAQEIANEQLALLEVKRPSIRIPLDGINEDLEMGTTVNITMVRPAVGAANYPIRMIQRKRFGKTGIKTIVYAGFGQTKWDEKVLKEIERIGMDARKALTDRLSSTPYDVGIGGVDWGDVGGGQAAVEAIIIAELVDGQSIDDAIDTLIATHNALVNPHQTKLDDLENPGGDKEFNFANKHLHFKWVAPAAGAHQGAFELEASGAFQNDLVHIHQHTGNPGASKLVYIEAEDDDVVPLNVVHGAESITFDKDGFQVGAGAVITEFDTAALADSDTKVPTNTTVKEYVDARVGAGKDTTAFHDNESGEIVALGGVVPNLLDTLLLEDQSDGNAKKKTSITNFVTMLGDTFFTETEINAYALGGQLGGTLSAPTVDDGADGSAFHKNTQGEINGLVAAVPEGGDKIYIETTPNWDQRECTLAALFSALGGISGQVITEFIPLRGNSVAFASEIACGDSSDSFGLQLWLDPIKFDTSQDITLTIGIRCTTTDAALHWHKYGATIKTDDTENHSWNLYNNIAYNIAVTATRVKKMTFTIANGSLVDDDWIYFHLALQETRLVYGSFATVTYTHI